MISLEKAKELIRNKKITDEKVREILSDSYALAEIILDEFLDREKKKKIKVN